MRTLFQVRHASLRRTKRAGNTGVAGAPGACLLSNTGDGKREGGQNPPLPAQL